MAVCLLVIAVTGVDAQEADEVQDNSPQAQMQQLDQLIQRYQAIELDAAFLASPGFRSLRDFSISLPRPLTVGRPNPYEPLEDMEEVDGQEAGPTEERPAEMLPDQSPGPFTMETIVGE